MGIYPPTTHPSQLQPKSRRINWSAGEYFLRRQHYSLDVPFCTGRNIQEIPLLNKKTFFFTQPAGIAGIAGIATTLYARGKRFPRKKKNSPGGSDVEIPAIPAIPA